MNQLVAMYEKCLLCIEILDYTFGSVLGNTDKNGPVAEPLLATNEISTKWESTKSVLHMCLFLSGSALIVRNLLTLHK